MPEFASGTCSLSVLGVGSHARPEHLYGTMHHMFEDPCWLVTLPCKSRLCLLLQAACAEKTTLLVAQLGHCGLASAAAHQLLSE